MKKLLGLTTLTEIVHKPKHECSEQWWSITIMEMKKFLGLIIITGITHKPKLVELADMTNIPCSKVLAHMTHTPHSYILSNHGKKDFNSFTDTVNSTQLLPLRIPIDHFYKIQPILGIFTGVTNELHSEKNSFLIRVFRREGSICIFGCMFKEKLQSKE
jgi:hypothetical protein